MTKYSGKIIEKSDNNCIIGMDDFDKVTRLRVIGIKNERLFTFTHEKLQEYFTDRPFIDAYGSILKNNIGEFFLSMTFIIDNKYIKTGYNGISTSNMLRISLINNTNIFLTNVLNDTGTIDRNNSIITYNGIFPIKKKDVKLLEKYEVNKMGVMWNGGFEEYNVYNMDFAIRQIECLNKLKFK
ncbi:MAG: hypothetical protein R2771_13800 [Saprospiraceae bacterium]